MPICDHHIVNLSRRSRVKPLEDPLDPDHHITRRRLHFVRGHWRHYENGRKSWLKPFFRGTPDLGFIDKEYRL